MATARPYEAEDRGGYWLLVDTRNGKPASYPTTKRQCQSEAAYMNREYAKAYATLVAEGVETLEAIGAGQY